MRCYTREGFLREYAFPLEPAHDFERNGNAADFASGHPWPKYWQNTGSVIDFGKDFDEKSETVTYKKLNSALSSDNKLLAISSNRKKSLVYDVFSKELRSTLDGAGKLVFGPVMESDHSGYTLISSLSDHEARAGLSKNQLILWDLDQHGRLLDEEEAIDAALFATKAVDAMLPDLVTEHEWTKEFAKGSNLHADFKSALERVAAEHRRRHHTMLNNARLSNYGPMPFSKDGTLLLYLNENGSSRNSMRTPDKLPQVVVYEVESREEIYRLTGHTDAIMWASLSPNDRHIASVSWDGTMRIYSADTGDLEWATENSGGPSWAGSFNP